MTAKAIIVDKDNIIIGHKDRSEITPDDIYRVSAARIVDESGNILLAQRSRTKNNNPGKRGPAVAGTLEEGETYESNIIKEIQEEIGIKMNIDDLRVTPIQYRIGTGGKNKYFGQRFVGIYTGDKKLLIKQDEEVEELRRFNKEKLEKELIDNPTIFLTSVAQKLKEFN